jgi:hypothetical protein
VTRFQRFEGWRRRWLAISHLLWLGLVLIAISGRYLVYERFGGASWRPAAMAVWACIVGFCWIWFLLNYPEPPRLDRPSRSGALWLFLLAACGVAAFSLRTHPGALPVLCAAGAAYVWYLGRVRRRSCAIALAAWLIAGLLPFAISWAYDQRFMLGVLLGGFGTAFQGAWDMTSFLLGRRPEWSQPPA